MKKLIFLVLLLTSLNVFGMFTSVADLRNDRIRKEPTKPKLERSWKNYAKLMWAAFKLDRLGSKYNRAMQRIRKTETNHFKKRKLLENNSQVNKSEKEKVTIKKEFDQKAQEFVEMQESLFNVSLCDPKIKEHYDIYSDVECGVTDRDISLLGRCTNCAWKEIQLFRKRLTKKQLEDDTMDWVHCQQ